MKDIKLKVKSVPVSSSKIPETIIEKKEIPSQISYFSSILFAFMLVSIGSYVFFVSSSVFFAVKTSKFTYKMESLANVSTESYNKTEEFVGSQKDRISFIDLTQDVNISIK